MPLELVTEETPPLDPLERASLDVLAELHAQLEMQRQQPERDSAAIRPLTDDMLLGMMDVHHCVTHGRPGDALRPLIRLAARAVFAAALIREGRI